MHKQVFDTNPTSVAIIDLGPLLCYGFKDMLAGFDQDYNISHFSADQDYLNTRTAERTDIVIIRIEDQFGKECHIFNTIGPKRESPRQNHSL